MRLALVACGIALAGSLVGVACTRSHAAEAANGKDLFASTCARCHGAEGSGGLPLYAGGPSPRNFRDHQFQTSRSDEQLRMIIVNGKGTGMPPFGKAVTVTEVIERVGR